MDVEIILNEGCWKYIFGKSSLLMIGVGIFLTKEGVVVVSFFLEGFFSLSTKCPLINLGGSCFR